MYQASFATFVLSSPENVLDANTAFVSLTLFNILRVPMNLLPILLVYLVSDCNRGRRGCFFFWGGGGCKENDAGILQDFQEKLKRTTADVTIKSACNRG